ncbi:TonB-dependent receptor [Riemerella anatipestifer]|uniref:TonB-dependent receptor n=1 Tax=Riemerella anatipestifer TaxID=34085 RepID=UPI0007EC5B2B|nr:TonB-dependent receptor plug domain-containing protein [Riemerella anatipestifer]MBT0552463.1 TonB-dependent receptor [Riemerella anatipestifer]MBT0554776.1 TonB-dependent receptor [Riemerella anatipestifer]MCE3025338.1 TonB-dependent receptor [Riemerella anatipestifer]MCU7543003.1 TonB-dependent receptor [Riemerella anatipestifer]MCU7560960.1 TonB-dependent receptor [Riemerella anatipestifer]
MKGFVFYGLFASSVVGAQQTPKDSTKTTEVAEVTFTKRLPISKDIINVEKELGAKNLGQDLPILLKNQMSVVSTSDAGNGIGYTGFRIRGTAGTSVNVMMNGVPYNDSESQGTFFVNVPDLTSSASQIVIQRGVGTSSNGAAAFGASVNIISREPEEHFYLRSDNSYGSFNTYKYSAEIGSGKFWDNRLSVMGRYTMIHSDGYINRAFSDLSSYNFTALFEEGKTRLRLKMFGGKEQTYHAWNGISAKTMQENRRYNPSGTIYSKDWSQIVGYYDNETDNYQQNHYQLLWQQKLNSNWNLETTLHYTKGAGYYENYRQDNKFSRYNLPNISINGNEISRTDFIRKKWLDNDFYGIVSNLYGSLDNLDLNFGLVGNQYYGWHFGNVTGVQFTNIHEHEYYRNRSLKNEVSGFAKAILKLNELELFGDLQLRNIKYDTKILTGEDEGLNFNKNWLFFNPKVGINYRIPKGKVFLSYAVANREPNRAALVNNPQTVSERLNDWEFGIEKQWSDFSLTTNAYYMLYKNQLVLSGLINDVGAFIPQNVKNSYRLGLEIGTSTRITEQLHLTANATISRNKIKELDSQNEKGEKVVLKDTDISFSPNIMGNIGLNYQLSPQFLIGLTQQYIGRQYLDNTQNKNYSLSDYFLADVNAKYNLKLNRTNIDFSLLINNLFNRKYANNGYVWAPDAYFFPQAGTNFMFGMSIKFQ